MCYDGVIIANALNDVKGNEQESCQDSNLGRNFFAGIVSHTSHSTLDKVWKLLKTKDLPRVYHADPRLIKMSEKAKSPVFIALFACQGVLTSVRIVIR